MHNSIKKPIFLIGTGRSGSSYLFQYFVAHEDLGWISNYQNLFPNNYWISSFNRLFDNPFLYKVGKKKNHHKGVWNKLNYPKPCEAYKFWNLHFKREFGKDYLLNEIADNEIIKDVKRTISTILHKQSKNRFTEKLTGPGRIKFLSSVFPDAMFINLVRDGRSFVHSILQSEFWIAAKGHTHFKWRNGDYGELEKLWVTSGKKANILAAIHWRNILEKIQEEAKELAAWQYHEIKYEDLIVNPKDILLEVYSKCDLEITDRTVKRIGRIQTIQNLNDQYKSEYSKGEIDEMTEVMKPMLEHYGYV